MLDLMVFPADEINAQMQVQTLTVPQRSTTIIDGDSWRAEHRESRYFPWTLSLGDNTRARVQSPG